MSSAVAARAEGIVKRVQQGSITRDVVAGVDIEVGEGEYLLLLGRSGSGKTTLLSMLGGLLLPDEGRVEVLGRDLGAMDARGRRHLVRAEIGWVFQTAGLLPNLTATENVAFALYLLGEEGGDVHRRVLEVLDWVGLGGRANHRTDELSGGEQQRVAFARALVKRPLLMLADEPTSQLDAETGAAMAELIRQVALSGTAVLVATHDEALAQFADRVALIDDGRIVVGAT